MKSVEKSIVIHTSPEKIWEQLAADRHLEWSPYMGKSKKFEYITEIKTPEDKLKPGTFSNFYITCFHEVLTAQRNKQVVYKIYEKNILGYCEGIKAFDMEETKDGVLLNYTIRFDKPVGFYGDAIYFFTHRWLAKTMEKELQSLKAMLENGA